MAAKISAHDTFYDLGSGLGQVPLLVRLLSGATTAGVEIEPAYCRYAQACADALRLTRVRFLNADARAVDYADGTVFFLFTPFTGQILARVLGRLRQVGQHQPLRIFSYGPGTQALAQEPWLRRLSPAGGHLYQLAEFRNG
nr:class I SAM-dependent methyltransferase [Hymenobacter ruricola]